MRKHSGQYNIEVGEWRLKAAMDIPRKIYSIRLEKDLHEYAKKLGGGNLSLGIRLALHRQKEPIVTVTETAAKKRKARAPRAKTNSQPRTKTTKRIKTVRTSLKRKRKRVS